MQDHRFDAPSIPRLEFDGGGQKVERAKEVIIVDASVVAKWFVEEEDTEEALKLREDYRGGRIDLWSTELMPFEVLNALRYNPQIGTRELKSAVKALSGYRIALYPILDELGEHCIANALAYGVSVYDSSYISLSIIFNKTLYTADDRLILKAKEVDTLRHIKYYGR